MCLAKIAKFFKKVGRLEPGKFISVFDLHNCIHKVMPEVEIQTWDWNYRLPPFDEVIQFINQDYTNLGIYVSDYHDCEDFAITLWGLFKAYFGAQYTTFGLLLTKTPTGYHAANFFVDDNYDVWILEPQNDHMWLVKDKLDWTPETVIV